MSSQRFTSLVLLPGQEPDNSLSYSIRTIWSQVTDGETILETCLFWFENATTTTTQEDGLMKTTNNERRLFPDT